LVASLEGNLNDSSELGELLSGVVLDIGDTLEVAWRGGGREGGEMGRKREVNIWGRRKEGRRRERSKGGRRDDDETNR